MPTMLIVSLTFVALVAFTVAACALSSSISQVEEGEQWLDRE
ncbi:MAG: hypothetical protein Kow0047_12040 [Anaerolineae bacterium]